MNAEERTLIAGLFDRMRGMQGIEKDREAADLISREATANPDAVYLLTQSVLVQEQALQKAHARIQELETTSATPQAPTPNLASTRKSPGFGQSVGGSVPSTGSRSPGFAPGTANAGPTPGHAPAANRGQGVGSQGGGFMAQAMTTAAGVAGGMLLASGISSMFSGGEATAAPASDAASAGEAASASDAPPPAPDQASAEDGAVQDASMDGGEDDSWFGGDWGGFGGDMDL